MESDPTALRARDDREHGARPRPAQRPRVRRGGGAAAHGRRRDAPLELALRPARDGRARQAAAALRHRGSAPDRRRARLRGRGAPRAAARAPAAGGRPDRGGRLRRAGGRPRPGRGRPARRLVRPDAAPARPARQRPQGVRRERLPRAAHAALLDRRLPRAPRRRGSRREHPPRVPRDDAEPGRPADEPRHRPARPLADGRRQDPDRARGGRARRGGAAGLARTSSPSPTPRATRS